jgi:hypothetical protein
MKRLFILIIATTLFCNANAQEKKNEKKSKWGIGFNLSNAGMFQKLWLNDYDVLAAYPIYTGGNFTLGGNNSVIDNYAIGLSGYYSMNGNKVFRIKAQIAKNDIHASDNGLVYTISPPWAPGATLGSCEINVKQTITSFEPSIIWNNEIKKITVYEGVTLPIILIGKYQSNANGAMTDLSNVIVGNSTSVNSLPGGFATGLGVVSGVDLNISNHFKLGMEFSFTYLYSHVEGEQTLTTAVTIPTYTFETVTGPFTQRRQEFSNINASINISYSF